ncbi:MAG: hypothetical protein ACI8QP_000299 [Porticoccaceae bacterium]|jgi:hypothetical protein
MKKQEILDDIKKITDVVISYVENLTDEEVKKSIGGKWSVNGNIEHLTKSIKPLTKAHKVPKFLLNYKFGKMNREGRSYEQVLNKYNKAMENNLAPSPNPFAPKENDTTDRNYILNDYKIETKKLLKSLNRWDEKDMDTYILPHPAIGKLSIREMLYFTH